MVAMTARRVFIECQDSVHCHGKLITALTKIYDQGDIETFWTDFVYHLNYALIILKREPAVERMVEFVAKFATSLPNPPVEEEQALDEDDDEIRMNDFLVRLFDYLLKYHSAAEIAVRFRCCQLLNKLFSNMPDNAQIDDDLYDKLYHAMQQRLRDKSPAVCIQAIIALTRLQDPRDSECPIIKAYLFLMSSDPSADVRHVALCCIALSAKTLKPVIERTRDIKDTVRKQAYLVLADKVNITALTIAQRIQVLSDGLQDHSDIVRDACVKKLLQAWLCTFQANILELLQSLDVETSLDICEKALTALFKSTSIEQCVLDFDLLDEDCLIPPENLSAESTAYWRCLCEYVHSLGTDHEDKLETIMPMCVTYCKYMNSFLDRYKNCKDVDKVLEQEFIAQQLLKLTAIMDLSDQAGRNELSSLIHHMLISTHVGHSLVSHFLPCLVKMHSSIDGLVCYLAETISEIREPIMLVEESMLEDDKRQIDFKIATVRVTINQLREDLAEAVQNQDFSSAAEIKEKISQLDKEKVDLLQSSQPQNKEVRGEKNDTATWWKCMTIVSELLKIVSIKTVNPTLQMLLETLILPGIEHEDYIVRNLATMALARYCLINKDLALQHMLLLSEISRWDIEEEVRITALKAIFDFLHLYGFDLLKCNTPPSSQESVPENNASQSSSTDDEHNEEENENDEQESVDVDRTSSTEAETGEPNVSAASNMLSYLSTLLDSESSEIRTLAAEGMAKLLLSGRITSEKIFSHLILLWFNPVTEDDLYLHSCLGTFFPFFAIAGKSNQELIEDAFLPTLKTLLRAPMTSPLSEVDAINVAQFLVQLTSARLLSENKTINIAQIKDHTIHDNIGEKVSNEILSSPESFNVRTLSKVLNMISLNEENQAQLKDLKMLAQLMVKNVKDKDAIKAVENFYTTVDRLYKVQADEETDDSQPSQTVDDAESESSQISEFSTDNDSQSSASFVVPNRITKSRNNRSLNMTSNSSVNESTLDISVQPAPKSTKKISRGAHGGRGEHDEESSLAMTPARLLTDIIEDGMLDNSVFASPNPACESTHVVNDKTQATPEVKASPKKSASPEEKMVHDKPSTPIAKTRGRKATTSVAKTPPRLALTPDSKGLSTRSGKTTPEPKVATPGKRSATPRTKIATAAHGTATPEPKLRTPRAKSAMPALSSATPEPKVGTPRTKSATPARSTTTPEPKVGTPRTKSVTPARSAATPEPKVGTPRTKSVTPARTAATPEPKVGTPRTKSVTPARTAATPEPKVGTPRTKSATPVRSTATPEPKVGTPRTKSATPARSTATPEPKVGTPRTKSATPARSTATPEPKIGTPRTKSATPARSTATPGPKVGTPRTKSARPARSAATPETKREIPRTKTAITARGSAMPEPRAATLGTTRTMRTMQGRSSAIPEPRIPAPGPRSGTCRPKTATERTKASSHESTDTDAKIKPRPRAATTSAAVKSALAKPSTTRATRSASQESSQPTRRTKEPVVVLGAGTVKEPTRRTKEPVGVLGVGALKESTRRTKEPVGVLNPGARGRATRSSRAT